MGLGIPESNARAYEEALQSGGMVIGVVPRSSEDSTKIKNAFKKFNGDNIVTT